MVRLSIITPTLNAAGYLESTIQSVAACGRQIPLEHIVIDGGSSDETLSILDSHRDKIRSRVVPQMGRAAALNMGMELARGDVIGWLDADDVYFPKAVAAALKHLDSHSKTSAVYGPAKVIDEDGQAYRQMRASRWSLQRIRRKNVVPLPSIFFRSSLIDHFGSLDPELRFHFDYDLWLRLALDGYRFDRLRLHLGGKRRHRGNRFFQQTDCRHWLDSAEEILRVVKRRLPEPSIPWALHYGHVMAACCEESRQSSPSYDRVVLREAAKVLSDWCGDGDTTPYGRMLFCHVKRECNQVLRYPRNAARFLNSAICGSLRPKVFRLRHHQPRILRLPESYFRETDDIHSNRPLSISIVTPNFNQGGLLERTIRSVVGQKYPRLEYIVQDGGSTDESVDVIKRYESEISFWESRPDRGQTHAINLGMKRATGDIMAYLNSDDLLMPGSLRFVAQYFADHPEVDIVYGNRILIDGDCKEIGRWVLPKYDDGLIQWADYIPQETMFWRRKAWEAVGETLDETFEFAMDWDLIMRFRTAGLQFRHIPRFLGAFRVLESQKTMKLIETVGQTEMNRIRLRELGRIPTEREIRRVVKPFVRKQWITHVRSQIEFRAA